MKNFIALLFAVLLSTNVFSYRLDNVEKNNIEFIAVKDDNGNLIRQYPKKDCYVLISDDGRLVAVFNKKSGKLLRTFPAQSSDEITDSVGASPSRTKRKVDDEWSTSPEKRSNIRTDDNDTDNSLATPPSSSTQLHSSRFEFPELTDEDFKQIDEEIARQLANTAAARTLSTPPSSSGITSSSANSPAKGGGGASAAATEAAVHLPDFYELSEEDLKQIDESIARKFAAAATGSTPTSTRKLPSSWGTSSSSNSPAKGGAASAAAAAGADQGDESISSTEQTSDLNYLEGPEKHQVALLEAINSARNRLVICSDTITFLDKHIYNALQSASKRGVKIDTYYRNKITDARVETFLNTLGGVHKLNLHAKFLIVDDKMIAIGSHNWFNFDVIDYESFLSGDKSFKIKGSTEQTAEIINLVLRRINDYSFPQRRSYTPSKTRKRYVVSEDSEYRASGFTHFSVLTSTKEHEDFLMEACKKAYKNLVIHSPFVNLYNAQTRIKRLAQVANPGVKITIKAWDSPAFRELFDFVNSNPSYEKIFKFFLMAEDNHSKMIMIDDMKLWSQGSFNWMSSSLTETARGHNLDATVVLEKRID